MRDEIFLELRERGDERAAVAEGPEPHVDAKGLPAGRELG